MSKDTLNTNEELHKEDQLVSSNGLWKAVFQNDGNFVIYGWKATWASDTNGSDGTRVVMQPDGNLVIYNICNQPKWNTATYTAGAHLNARVELTDEGNLVLFKENVKSWSSADSRGQK
ncbi:mannose-specific lectin-like [Notolabrus celidotus]|uniref:mannose-specific lectin-like n=1 Tax=Notolabrus celidotus TaxID=1203425 RepID=UPI00148F9C2D|nr:mannose-specific lectin-like [Notolabrus celidotus]